jgi:hypothetical protein
MRVYLRKDEVLVDFNIGRWNIDKKWTMERIM